jgi:glycosyltransferase involved in cell wall biosynthesis
MISNKLHIIAWKYSPTDAITNRLLTFAKGLGELGVNVNVLFLSSRKFNSINNIIYPNVIFNFLLDEQPKWLSKIKYISIFYSIYLSFKFLKKKDKVLLTEYIFPLFLLLSFKNIELYHERTEHPDLFFNRSMISRFQKRIYLKRCRYSAGLFVISNSIKSYFINNKIDEKKIVIVNMTIDPDRFNDVIKQSEVEDYIAYCGTVSNAKDGVDYLIKAFNIVAIHFPTIKLYIIGRNVSESDKLKNETLVDQFGLKDRVVFTGKISAEQIPQYLKNAKILALARPANLQASSGFPTKLGEYLMTENPVVITRTGEIDHYLKDFESCFFSIPNNEKDMADKIIWILQNYDKSIDIAKEGKKIAMIEFNYKAQTQKIYDAIFC